MKTIFSKKIIFGAAILTTLMASGVWQKSNAQEATAETSTQPPPAAELPSDIQPNSPLAQVIRLAQSGVDESVILSYINSSSGAFNLTPDQIIYLKDLGLPNEAVTAMIQRDQQLGATANPTPGPTPTTTQTETPEQPADVTQNYFYDTLSPYGGWVNVDGYGLCWRPTVVIYDSNWQPYCDHGHWINTDAGWFWSSDYSWGATAFHYGRWFHHDRFGWCWYPDTVWAPSWVMWRYGNDYCGWAPLPPRTVFRPGVGIFFNGAAVSAGFDFGLSVNFFTFVPTRNFCDPHPRRFRAAPGEVNRFFNRTTVINNFAVNSHDHTFVNNGIPPERISAVTHTQIQRFNIHDSSGSVPHGQQISRDTLIVNRPHLQENVVANLNKGIKPPVVRQNISRPSVNENGNNFIPHTQTAPQNHQNNFSTPERTWQNPRPQNSQPQIPPATTHNPPPAARFGQPVENFTPSPRIESPRGQQFEESRAPRMTPRDSEIPAERQIVVPRENDSAPPKAAQPAPQNNNSSSQKSDKDWNQPGAHH
jgi:hypothetical protein